MKNRIPVLLAVMLLLFCTGSLFAQKRGGKAGAKLIVLLNNAKDDKGGEAPSSIQVTVRETPRFLMDNYTYEHSRKDKKRAKGWVEIVVPFKTERVMTKNPVTGKDMVSNPWLENIQVDIDVLSPVLNDQQQVEWGILHGSATLAPVSNVKSRVSSGGASTPYEYHQVRFYLSPYVVARYVALKGDAKKFIKFAAGFPVQVTFHYGNMTYSGGRAMGKDFADVCNKAIREKKLLSFPGGQELVPTSEIAAAKMFTVYQKNPRAFFVLDDAILPVSRTPWAWFEYDKQEQTIDKPRSR